MVEPKELHNVPDEKEEKPYKGKILTWSGINELNFTKIYFYYHY